MSKKSLLDAFNIPKTEKTLENVIDYEVFQDKELLDKLRIKIVENLIDSEIPENKQLNQFINDEINKTIEGYDLSNLERSHLYNLIDNEINGYGPLTELLEDKNISEIMVNSPKEIYIETDEGLVQDESISFINEEHIIRTIQKLLAPLGKTIDITNPIIDTRISNGTRIHAIIPPLSPKGAVITIQKSRQEILTPDDFIRIGSMTPYMASFLEAAVKAKCNILVCGGNSSGKTLLLNMLGTFIADEERIITIEETNEIKLQQKHVISLETPSQEENKITMQDLIVNSLKMHPNRLIVGEIRFKEAFEVLRAMNIGLDGSMTSIYANGPKDAINRLENMVLMSEKIPLKAIKEYIISAIDLIVNIERTNDGRRKITSIAELTNGENKELKINEIFAFHQKGLTTNNEVDGEFILYKEQIPKVYQKIKARGINDIDFMFQKAKKAKKRR